MACNMVVLGLNSFSLKVTLKEIISLSWENYKKENRFPNHLKPPFNVRRGCLLIIKAHHASQGFQAWFKCLFDKLRLTTVWNSTVI